MIDCFVMCVADPNNTCITGKMRLVGGEFPSEGRLEICYRGHWGTVCDDEFGSQEASLVCRELGFPSEGALCFNTIDFG